MQTIKTCWKYLSMQEFQQGDVIIARTEANQLQPQAFSWQILEAYGFLRYATEELRDGESADKLSLIAIFIRQCENLHDLPSLRDFWLVEFARQDHVARVQALLEKGADVEAKDGSGRTPLGWAAEKGYEGIVKQLLEKGADVEAKGGSGRTPLSWAARNRYDAVVRQLQPSA
jgi:ankyrin repeat protein